MGVLTGPVARDGGLQADLLQPLPQGGQAEGGAVTPGCPLHQGALQLSAGVPEVQDGSHALQLSVLLYCNLLYCTVL